MRKPYSFIIVIVIGLMAIVVGSSNAQGDVSLGNSWSSEQRVGGTLVSGQAFGSTLQSPQFAATGQAETDTQSHLNKTSAQVASSPGDVIIAGFQPRNRVKNQDPGEFIELFNTTGQTISLENMHLISRVDNDSDGLVDIDWQLSAQTHVLTGLTITPHSFFLIAESGVAAPGSLHDLPVDIDLATNEGGVDERAISLQLLIDGVHMDYVLYGRDDGSDPPGEVPPGDIPLNDVPDFLVSSGATWRYLDDGSDQGIAWQDPAFDDSTWVTGPAQLGYGDGDEATVVGFGPDAGNKFITTYFRHSFNVIDPAALPSLTVRLLRDDGGVVYLNGAEILRSNMPGGAIDYLTLTDAGVAGSAESSFFNTILDSSLLVPGINVLAVEIHQSSPSSSDISFDLELAGGELTRIEVIRNTRGLTNYREGLARRLSARDLYDAYDVPGYYTDEDSLGSGNPVGVWTSPHEDTFFEYEARNSLSPTVIIPGNVNSPPVINPISDQNLIEGESLAVPVSASDSDGDLLTLSTQNLPTFVSFNDNGDGTGTLNLSPIVGDYGAYFNVSIIADDRGGAPSTASFTIFVRGNLSPIPVVETTPVPNSGDAADDIAIWIHPTDPSQSTIIGTDKQGGLAVYDLTGAELQFLPDGNMNNVDIRYNFPLNGQLVALVTAGNRTNNTIAMYQVNPTTRLLENVAARTIAVGINQTYGVCMYRSPSTGKFYFIVNDTFGAVEQWELFGDGNGKVDAVMVRTFAVGSQTEGCVADDELGDLYIGEETVGIWKYGAEPGDGTGRIQVDSTSLGGHLTADVEGLTLYYAGNGTGYLIASSQGSDEFVVYQREGNNDYLATFQIVDGNGIDDTTSTDGIDVTNFPLGPTFPQGVFIAQDNRNPGSLNQNFKLVQWWDIAQAAGLSSDTSRDPRQVEFDPAPSVLAVIGSESSVQVTFSEPLDPVSATDTANYSIDPDITVSNAALETDQKTVTLTTTAHTEGVINTLIVSGVADQAGNVMSPTPVEYQYNLSLAGHWSFGEGVGTIANDGSGNGNTGTLENGTVWVGGLLGSGGVGFDGTDDLVRMADSDSLDFGVGEDFSISFWFRDSTSGGNVTGARELLEKQGGSVVYQVRSPNLNGDLRVQIKDGTNQDEFFTTAGNLADGQWHHVVIIRDYDIGISAYVDGNLAGSNNVVTVGSLANTGDLQLGGGSSGSYDGELDEVQIFRKVLSGVEITQLHVEGLDNTPPSDPGNLVATLVTDVQVDLSWDASVDLETGVSHYIVYRDDVEVGQATGTTYTDGTVVSGTLYTYKVSAVNGAGAESGLSAPLPVTTTADGTLPSILSVIGSETSVEVTFSEPLDPVSATDTANYLIDPDITVSNAALEPDQETVTLTTTAHTEGVINTLMVSGVADQVGNVMSPTSVAYQFNVPVVGRWTFNEGVGTVANDESGNGNTGTLENGTAWVGGLLGSGGVGFDGINDLVRVADSDSLDFGVGEDFSISFWLRDSTSGGNVNGGRELLEKQSGGVLYQVRSPNKNGDLRVQIKDGTNKDEFFTTAGNLADGQWHHVVIIRDYDIGISAYVDGNLAGSNNVVTVGSLANTGDLQFGGGNSGSYDGELDEVQIFRKVLSQAEVTLLHVEGLDNTPPSDPSILVATLVTDVQVDLSWDASVDLESGVSHYIVYRDDLEVGQATGTTYTDGTVLSGTEYTYKVSAVNGAGGESGRSAPLPVTTTVDAAPPSILSVIGNLTSVEITFSEPLDPVSATDTANYSIDPDIPVSNAALELDQETVTLTTTAHTEGVINTLVVSGVADQAGNAMSPTSVAYQFNSGLVGRWSFDEGVGPIANDGSGNGNTGTLVNGPTWVDGKLGKALRFDPLQSQSVLVGHSDELNFGTGSFSIGLWLKYLDDVDADVLRKGSTNTGTSWYKIEVPLSSQKLLFNVKTDNSSSTITSGVAYNDGQWHHVVAIRDVENGLLRLYVDGAQVASATNPSGSVFNTANLSFGSKDTLDDDFFSGDLDEISIYSRALSSTEVTQMFVDGLDNTPPSDPGNLVATLVTEVQVDLSWDASVDLESGVSHYIVYRDDLEVGQATGTTFTDSTVVSGTGYTYKVSAVNGEGGESGRSAPLPVTTTADGTLPSILSVTGNLTSVEITFSKPLDPVSATATANYSIDPDITVSNAALEPDQETVILTTTAHTEGVINTLMVSGVADQVGNVMSPTSVGYQFNSGLVGRWSFDEGVGTIANDGSVNGNTGTLENGTVWVGGVLGGGGVGFDGINDLVRVADSDSLDFGVGEDFSISFWFLDSTSGRNVNGGRELLEKQSGGVFYQVRSPNKNGDLRIQIDDGTNQDNFFTTAGNLADGQWHHVVIIRDYDLGISAYVDGNLAGSNNVVTAGSLANTGDLQLGGGNSGSYDGELDEVQIYRKVLSGAEVTQLFNAS